VDDLLPVQKANRLIYEYACHEGNQSMEHVLLGSRAAENKTAAK
jgi:hypothetical protein